MSRLRENRRRLYLTKVFRNCNVISVELSLHTEAIVVRFSFSAASDAHVPPVTNFRICALTFLEGPADLFVAGVEQN